MAGTRDWRVIAVRALTGEFLSWDVPLADATTTRELSGPGGVFGRIDPEMLVFTAADGRPLIEEWSTALFVEEAGQIRGGGIVQKVSTQGTSRSVEAPGYSAYPNGIPYTANYLPSSPPDPTAVFQDLWEYVQSHPDAGLGVTVNQPGTWMRLTGGDGAFVIRDHEYRDCGELMGQIAQATPFDYLEQHTWNSGRTGILHQITVGFPRVGRKRDDLRFADGENIVGFGVFAPDGERYANDVYYYGQGSGRAMLRSRATVRDGRIRRCAVVPAATIGSQGYLDREARAELQRRRLLVDVPEVTVMDHANARLASILPGDDILFDAEVPWHGRTRTWLRVLSIEESADNAGQAILKTQRSDSFTYAAETSPTGATVPVQV